MAGINWRHVIRTGLLMGLVVLVASAIGMVEAFDERDLIVGYLTLGQLLLFAPALFAGYQSVEGKRRLGVVPTLLGGAVAGLVTVLPVTLLVLLASIWPNIRDFFVNVSPALINILTNEQGATVAGLGLLLGEMTVLGLIGAAIHLIPGRIRRPLTVALLVTVAFALFSDVPLNIANELLERSVVRVLFGTKGITLMTAVAVFVISLLAAILWTTRGRAAYEKRRANMTPERADRSRRITTIALLVFLLILPQILGVFLTNVLDQVGIFILMALGLNIVVGFAGLLDLGYVAFFAIGAYVTALMTSTGALGLGLSFWLAVPVAVLAATLAGTILGIPVLRMRGDYLAIVTLGFGEIIRVLVRSDLLKPVIGGAQGILNIGRPTIGSFEFVSPQQFYYLILAGCILAWFIAGRLRDGRLGRRWMAMREDEDVAEAVGINLTATKLLAFSIGASFAGLAGSIFASRIGSVFPNSFELLISINVLAIVIVGGLGSLPGVVLGAFVLVGLPELLREFEEYRLLMYGILLIVMMLVRPEGLWPSAVTRREMHAAEEEAAREGIHHEEVHPIA
jgi:branched-chain amino acid transport system permease protein